jgi:hypothetical protein
MFNVVTGDARSNFTEEQLAAIVGRQSFLHRGMRGGLPWRRKVIWKFRP